MVCASALISAGLFLSGCTKPADPVVTPGAASTPGGVASVAQAATPVARDHVIVGVDIHSTPMAFWDPKTGIAVGYDIDMAKEGLKRAGLKYEFKPIDWGKKDKNLLEEKSIDLIWSSFTITDERKRTFEIGRASCRERVSSPV